MALHWFGQRSKKVYTDRDLVATFRKALLEVLAGDYDQAEELIRQAVQADSEDMESYRSLARLYSQRGEIGRAIRIHQNLLLRPDLSAEERNAVLSELAGDFRQGGFLERAIASYQEVLSHDAQNREALEALSALHSEAREFREALAMVMRLAKVERRKDPAREARLWVGLAQAEYADGHHDAARKALKKALRRDASNVDARILLGQLLAERGKNKAALAAWRVVAEQGSARAGEVHSKLEASFAALGRAREYETFLRGLLEERPDDAAARLALSSTLAARGETDSAVLELRRVLDTHPEKVAGRIALGRVLLGEGRDAEALKEYGQLLEWLFGRSEAAEGGGALASSPVPGGEGTG
jgi:lipopolysaccharide biosynthesis regulator YciM